MMLYNQSNAFLKISSYHISLLRWRSVRFFFALDSMTLLDRFLFNEAVEDTQTYNDMIEILLENQAYSPSCLYGQTVRKDWSETYAGMGRKILLGKGSS